MGLEQKGTHADAPLRERLQRAQRRISRLERVLGNPRYFRGSRSVRYLLICAALANAHSAIEVLKDA